MSECETKQDPLVLGVRLLTAALSCLALAAAAGLAIERIVYPYEIGYGEGGLLHTALRVAHGGGAYSPTQELPYVPNVYGPLYPYAWSLFARWCGASWWPGRLIATLAAVAVSVCLYLAVRAVTKDRWAGVIAVALFVSSWPMRTWVGLARVDLPAVALAMTGVLLTTGRRPWLQWLGVVCFIAAVFTKQSMVAAPVAVCVWYAARREWRLSVTRSGAWAAASLATFLVLNLVTRGAAWREMVMGNVNPWHLAVARQYFAEYVRHEGYGVMLGLTAALVLMADSSVALFGLYAAAAGLVAVSVGKDGSDVNYFIETAAVVAVLCGFGLYRRGLFPTTDRRALIAWLLACALLAPGLKATIYEARHVRDDENCARAVELAVANAPGPVFGDALGAVIRAGKTVWTEPFVTTLMANAGSWDQGALLRMIEDERFALIVTERDWGDHADRRTSAPASRLTVEQIQMVDAHYRQSREVGRWHLLVPAGRGSDLGSRRR